MKKEEKFLNLYREYETLIRGKGLDPKDAEDAMDEIRQGRMRLCRQFRNYMSHTNDIGFIEPTDEMISFLQTEVSNLQMEGDTAKKHLKSATSSTCTPSEKCVDVLLKMCKLMLEDIVVYDEKTHNFYAVNVWNVASAVSTSKTSKIKDVKPCKKKIHIVSPVADMENISRTHITICTSDGTAEGKLLGLVWIK